MLLACFALTLLGCTAVDRSLKNYEACQGDQQCMDDMLQVKDTSYQIARGAALGFPLPSIPETIALVISNIAAPGLS